MAFSLHSLHQMDDDLETALKAIGNTNQTALMKHNKDSLVNFVLSLAGVVNRSQLLLRSAAATIDELKSNNLKSQSSLITLQQEVIGNKSEQLDSVKSTVKTEMQTWASVVKKSCSSLSTVAPNKLKEEVKSAVSEVDRSHNFVIFGADEEEEQAARDEVPVTDETLLSKIFQKLECGGTSYVEDHYRAGLAKTGTSRPLIVKLSRPQLVIEVLSNAKKLKGTRFLGSVFLAPDRSPDERREHKKLVEEMKKRRGEEPDKYFFVKRGKVCSAARTE